MGTTFKIVLYTTDSLSAAEASGKAFKRIAELDTIMSDYIPSSELNQLSKQSGNGSFIHVSTPIFDVFRTAQRISSATDGFFDITIGPYVKLWRNQRKLSVTSLPSPGQLKKAKNSVGYQFIRLNKADSTVKLTKMDMDLDLGGIGKGYATQEALKVLQQEGIKSALIDGGGDISVGAPPPDSKGWHVSVPLYEPDGNLRLKNFVLSNVSIATSGNLFQYLEIDGRRYSHIIDPRTGLGVIRQTQVTVIAPHGAEADAYASAFSVAGIRHTKKILANLSEIEVYMTELHDDSLRSWQSEGLPKYVNNPD